MSYSGTKKLSEHDAHDYQHEERIQYTPCHTKGSAFILLLEVAFYQFFE